MNKVEPIRDVDKIKKIEDILLNQNYRDFLLFSLGINTGFRISDILQLKVKDFRDKNHFKITEEKQQIN